MQKVTEHERIDVLTGATPTGFVTDAAGRLTALTVERGGRSEQLPADGAFVLIGLSPNNDLVRDMSAGTVTV